MNGAPLRSGKMPLLSRLTGCHRTSLARVGTLSALANEQLRDISRCVPAVSTFDRCRGVLLPRLICARLALSAYIYGVMLVPDLRIILACCPLSLPRSGLSARPAPAAHSAMQRADHSGIVLRVVGSAVRIDQSMSRPLATERFSIELETARFKKG